MELLRWVRRVAPCRLPVLITGESGCGKEGIARALHAQSPRRSGPFLAVNCAALPEALLESELFGATRGAYTGADRDRPGLFRLADGGTLFLDEVGDMPLPMQAKLLRALQEASVRPVGGEREVPVDARIVAATHQDLAAMAACGRFRADLYYRLAIVELRVPPLRERRGDIPLLAGHLLARLGQETGQKAAGLDPAALPKLEAYPWPGNVRELEAVLARAMLRAGSRTIEAGDLDIPSPRVASTADGRTRGPLERDWIETLLDQHGGNVSRTASRIGWTRQKLYRRMKALGIRRQAPDQVAGPGGSGTGRTPSSSSTFQ